jgi:dUTP diphosphatase
MTAVEVLLLQLDPGLELPSYAHPGDAGVDLGSSESFELRPGERRLVGTGVAISLPDGYAAFVHPRSGLAARHGVTIVNAPGTVDAGYRGEIKVCLINTDRTQPVNIARGDRIAQLVVQPVSTAVFVPVTELPSSARGIGGYGSTGGILSGANEPAATQRGDESMSVPRERG